MPPRLSPELLRIARRLTALELMANAPGAADDDLAADLHPGDPGGRDVARFAGYYTEEGIRNVVHAYGLHEALLARGLGDWDLRFERDDPFHHRLVVFVGGVDDPDHRIMDLRLHLCRVRVPAEEGEGWDVVVVEWLSMQDPRATFSPARPRLPGQRHPGTGLGRRVHDLLVLMARRLGRDGLVNVPERPHLAELYLRAGYVFVDEAAGRRTRAALDAVRTLPFAARAWALERGFVVDEEGAAFAYRPADMVLPVSEALEDELSRRGGFLSRIARLLGSQEAPPRFTLDVEGFRRSLEEDPVEGLPASVLRNDP